MRRSSKQSISARLVGLAYLFSLLFPHFLTVTHIHDGGAADHHHTRMSLHDVALERAVLELIPEGQPRGEAAHAPKPRLESREGREGQGSPHLDGLRVTDPDNTAHTHGRDLPNLPTLDATAIVLPESALVLEVQAIVPEFVPALAILASPARAPPRA